MVRNKTKEEYEAEWMGRVFGNVEVGEYSHSKNGNPYFWCTCLKCGVKFGPVRLDSLKSGASTSCGHCLERTEIGNRYGHYVVREYHHRDKGSNLFFLCDCDCGEEGVVRLDSLKSGASTSCGCRTESKGEEKIRLMLEKMEVKFKQEYTGFTDMKDERVLRCDFWLPGFNRVIEFDGENHYKERKDFEDGHLEGTQRRDQIKNQYCWDHGIDIVRIPYWELDNFTMEDLVNKYSKYLVKKEK